MESLIGGTFAAGFPPAKKDWNLQLVDLEGAVVAGGSLRDLSDAAQTFNVSKRVSVALTARETAPI